MTAAAVEVDDPLVEQVARAIATKAAEQWGIDHNDHPWIDGQASHLLPTVRATVAALKEMGRLLPEGVTRREVLSRFDGKVREFYDRPMGLQPRPGPEAWIERQIVWETAPARPEVTP